MDKYTVVAPASFPAGAVLSLTKDQVEARKHALEKKGKHWVTTKPVQFKAGEVFGYEGDLPKTIAVSMKAQADSDAEAAAKAKEAEDKAKSEAEAKAKEEAEAAEKSRQEAETAAKAVWDGSDELQAQYPDFADYLASLDALGDPV